MFLPSNITLQFGDSGDFVAELQRRLCLVHCFSDDMVNSFYDGNTVNAVTRFQAMVGLHADGVAGPETLRRLNGVISGGGSMPTEPKEEEKAPAAMSALDALLAPAGTPALDVAALAATSHAEAKEAAPALPSMPATTETELFTFQAPTPPTPLPESLRPRIEERPPEQAPHHHTGHAHSQRPAEQAHARPHVTDPAAQQKSEPPGATAQPAQAVAPAAATEPPARQGILGRAMQYANTMVQKLADYFESKLPPSVLGEVKAIGQTMLSHGMRETPVPAGPELPPPSQTPGRGAGQQRG